jgi:hypothetical protein
LFVYKECLEEYKPILKKQSTEDEYNKIVTILELEYNEAKLLTLETLKDYYLTLDDYLREHIKEVPMAYGNNLIENTKSNLIFVVEHYHKINKCDFLFDEELINYK